jgi:hypothetical protein
MTPKEANAALIKAARTRDIDALKAALAAGADVNKTDSLYGVNALANMSMFTDEEAPTREVIKIHLCRIYPCNSHSTSLEFPVYGRTMSL